MLLYILFSLVPYALSSADIEQILFAENTARSILARAGHVGTGWVLAANMRQLKWNTTLSLLSHIYARKHPIEVGGIEKRQGYTVFHTIGHLTDFKMAHEDAKNKFAQAELTEWSPRNLNTTMFDVMGGAMQMFWAQSSEIGCDVERWQDRAGEHTIMVCLYDVAMRLNRPVYLTGVPCSHCPMGTKCDYDTFLCY